MARGDSSKRTLLGEGDAISVVCDPRRGFSIEFRDPDDGSLVDRFSIAAGSESVLPVSEPVVVKPSLGLNDSDTTDEVDHLCVIECFPADTLLWTAYGPVRVESLAPGTELVPMDAKNVAPLFGETVRRMAHRLVTVTLESGEVRSSTGHEFLTARRGWVAAAHLEVGDIVRTRGGRHGECVLEVELEQLATPVPVYDVHVTHGDRIAVGSMQAIARAKTGSAKHASVASIRALARK